MVNKPWSEGLISGGGTLGGVDWPAMTSQTLNNTSTPLQKFLRIPDAAGGSNVILAGEALNGPPTFTSAA